MKFPSAQHEELYPISFLDTWAVVDLFLLASGSLLTSKGPPVAYGTSFVVDSMMPSQLLF